jgi:hypothetical protein
MSQASHRTFLEFARSANFQGESRRLSPAQGIGGALSTVGGLGGRRRTDPKGQEAGAIAEPWQPAAALTARLFCGKEAPLYGALKSKKCAKLMKKSEYIRPISCENFS